MTTTLQRPVRTQLTNVAFKKTATASSEWSEAWKAEFALDGHREGGDGHAWAPKNRNVLPADELTWWQVDLGRLHRVWELDLTTLSDRDYPLSRYNFEIQASEDRQNMSHYRVLGRVDSIHSLPIGGTLTLAFDTPVSAQYIRVVKLTTEANPYFDMAIAEFRVWAE